jgi:hypothetical protein
MRCRRSIHLQATRWLFRLLIAATLYAPIAGAQEGTAAYLAVGSGGSQGPGVVRVDTSTNRLAGNIALPEGANPSSIAMRPDGRFAYVTLPAPVNTLAVVDTLAGSVSTTVAVGDDPFTIAMGPVPTDDEAGGAGGCAIAPVQPGAGNSPPAWLLPAVLLAWRQQRSRASTRSRCGPR